MKLVPTLSTHLFALSTLNGDILAAASEAGFSSLEIFAAPQHFPIHDLDRALELLETVGERGMKTAAFHAPFYMSLEELIAGDTYALGDRAVDRRARALASTKALLSVAAAIDSPAVVVHMGHTNGASADARLFIDGVEELLREVSDFSGSLLLENTPHVAESLEELDEVGGATPPDRVGFCIDLGHLHIHRARAAAGETARGKAARDRTCGMSSDDAAQRDLLDRVLRRTRHFHVHDNGGGKDEHLPPGEGNIDWEAVMDRLDALPGEATFSLELRDSTRGRPRPDDYLDSILARISGPVRDRFIEGGIRL